MNLEEIRTEIDALDKELLALFERRMDLCRDVALYKKEHNLPVFRNGKKSCWTRSSKQPPQTASMLHARCSLSS